MKIGVVGASGRMGRMVVTEIAAAEGCVLAGGTESRGHAAVGADLAATAGLAPAGIAIGDDAAALFNASDAVIDFTAPAATCSHAVMAAETETILVVGTTGLDADQQGVIQRAAEQTTIVQAPNFSIGVNLLLALSERVAGVLDEGYDIEIVEMHHKHKVDAPSGTALGLGRAAAAGRGVDFDRVAARARDGVTGERRPGDIGFAVLRGGDVVGDHTVVFAGMGERIELTHKASSRGVFARGAVRAARWAEGKAPGLYTMMDVLGFGD